MYQFLKTFFLYKLEVSNLKRTFFVEGKDCSELFYPVILSIDIVIS